MEVKEIAIMIGRRGREKNLHRNPWNKGRHRRFVNFQGLAVNFIPHDCSGILYLTRNMEGPVTTMSVNCTPLELLDHSTTGLLSSVPNVAGEGREGERERWKEERDRDRDREKVHREAAMDRQTQTKTNTETDRGS